MWAILASPLIVGSDLTAMDPHTVETLTNTEVIALNQDPLGIQAARVRKDGDLEVFAKPLEDGDQGVALLNRGDDDVEMRVDWTDLSLDVNSAAVRDLWAHEDLGTFDDRFTATVASHEAVVLRVRPDS
jgi:alpha-galactosidase